MKKLLIALLILAVIFGGAFMFLLSQATPDKAPSEEVTVEIETPRAR